MEDYEVHKITDIRNGTKVDRVVITLLGALASMVVTGLVEKSYFSTKYQWELKKARREN